MGFRTVEITGPAEIHIRSRCLIVEKEQEKGKPSPEEGAVSADPSAPVKKKRGRPRKQEPEKIKVSVPLEDISTIVFMGAGVRISSMAMARGFVLSPIF